MFIMANFHQNSLQDLKTAGMNSGPVSSAWSLSVKMPALRFLTLQFVRSRKTFHNLNLFCIQKNVYAIAGKVKSASRLRNGTLLFEGLNSKLLKTTLLKFCPH
jgi:hypothetical protein